MWPAACGMTAITVSDHHKENLYMKVIDQPTGLEQRKDLTLINTEGIV